MMTNFTIFARRGDARRRHATSLLHDVARDPVQTLQPRRDVDVRGAPAVGLADLEVEAKLRRAASWRREREREREQPVAAPRRGSLWQQHDY